MPAAAIQCGDAERWQGELIGYENEPLIRLGVWVLELAERYRNSFWGIIDTEDYGLIADSAARAIDGSSNSNRRNMAPDRESEADVTRCLEQLRNLRDGGPRYNGMSVQFVRS